MRQLQATLRHRPAPLAGTLIALTLTAMFVTWAISLGKGASSSVPVQRLANAAVVVTGTSMISVTSGSGPSASTFTVPLNGYRRLPATLLTKLTAIPGVQGAAADRSGPAPGQFRCAQRAPRPGDGQRQRQHGRQPAAGRAGRPRRPHRIYPLAR